MAQFSVLTQPWIPVKRLDGTQKEVGLLDALLHAQQYTGICCESPLEEYSIQRLLIAFLMDAYQPESYRDRRTLYRKGGFDADTIHGYIALCQSEGVSFDLFDEETPFMQAKYEESMDKGKEKPVSNIMHTAVTGNNHIHFEHHFETDYSLTYAHALRAMLASYVFCTAGVQGYPSSVNNTPCNYYLCKGETLFHTLVLNMLSQRECGNIPWDELPVAWRDKKPIIPKEEYATISILAAFTWQPRRITLIATDGMVMQVFYQQGKNFLGNGVWMEPHAAFGKSKKGEWFTIKPKLGRALWRDVGTVAASKDGDVTRSRAPLPSLSYHQIIADMHQLIPLRVTGLVTSQAAMVELQEDTLSIPAALLSEPELGEQLRLRVDEMEQLAKEIPRQYEPMTNAVALLLQEQYFIACHKFLFTDYLSYLAEIDDSAEGWQENARECFNIGIAGVVKEVHIQAQRCVGSGAQNLITMVQCNEKFYRISQKIMK